MVRTYLIIICTVLVSCGQTRFWSNSQGARVTQAPQSSSNVTSEEIPIKELNPVGQPVVPNLLRIEILPPTQSILKDAQTNYYKVQAFYDDVTTQDVSAKVEWSVPTGYAETVEQNANGLKLKGTAATLVGGVDVKATFQGKSATAKLVVAETAPVTKVKVPVSLVINPSEAFVLVGASTNYMATVNYDDGSSLDVTPVAQWNSANLSYVKPQVQPGTFQLLSVPLTVDSVGISASLTLDGKLLSANAKLRPVDADFKINDSIANQTVAPGSQLKVDWKSVNADSCSINAPLGFSGLEGSRSATVTWAGAKVLSLVCTKGALKVTKNITITTGSPAAITLTVNGSSTVTTINYSGSANVSWSLANVTNCSIDQGIGAQAASGSVVHNNIIAERVYNLTCQDVFSNLVQKSVRVLVNPAPTALPTVSLYANVDSSVKLTGVVHINPNTVVDLSWDVKDALSCKVKSSSLTSGEMAVDYTTGKVRLGALKDNADYKLECRNGAGSATSNVISVRPQFAEISAADDAHNVIGASATAIGGVSGHAYAVRNSNIKFSFASINAERCSFIYFVSDDSPTGGSWFEDAIDDVANPTPITRTHEFWDSGYFLKCSSTNSDGSIVTTKADMTVHTLNIDVYVNDSPGDITINANQPVTVRYRVTGWSSCDIEDSFTHNFTTLVNDWSERSFTVTNIDSTRGLVAHCQITQGAKVVGRNSPHVINVFVPTPTEEKLPRVVSGLWIGVDRGQGPSSEVSQFDNNLKVCVDAQGQATITKLAGRGEVAHIIYMIFHIEYLNGEKLVMKPIRTEGTFQLGVASEWAGVKEIGRGGYVQILNKGSMQPGKMPAIVVNAQKNSSIGQNCVAMFHDQIEQSGNGWLSADFRVGR